MFSHPVIKDWNSLSLDIRFSSSINIFLNNKKKCAYDNLMSILCRENGKRLTISANSLTKSSSTQRFHPSSRALHKMKKCRPLPEPIRFQDLMNSAHSHNERKMGFIATILTNVSTRDRGDYFKFVGLTNLAKKNKH